MCASALLKSKKVYYTEYWIRASKPLCHIRASIKTNREQKEELLLLAKSKNKPKARKQKSKRRLAARAASKPRQDLIMIPYIRVKRKSQTVFLDVQFSDTFASVKEKLGALFHLPPQHIQLWQGLNQASTVMRSSLCDLLLRVCTRLQRTN